MRFWVIFLLLIPFIGKAQKTKQKSNVQSLAPCSGPGSAPILANAVCGNVRFTENNTQICTGVANLPNPTAGCGDIVTTDNSLWYRFHCYGAGQLGFLLTPFNAVDDFDWEILDVTGRNPNDVYTTELRVSLNLSGVTGPTGCTAAGTTTVACGGGPPGSQFNRLVDLLAGHDYLLMVNNWSSSGQGYFLDFSGTAVLTNNADPLISNVATLGCDASKLKVDFNDDMLCNSVTPLGTEFTIIGAATTITGVLSNCTTGINAINTLTIDLPVPLPSGNYTLRVADGTDGNTFLNVCGRPLAPVDIPFTVAAQVPLDFNTINFISCAPRYIDVDFNKLFLCSSLTSTGSEFSIMPGNPAITSVNVTCVNGRATGLRLNLANPLPWGNYNLIVNNGTDGNTLSDTCNIDMVAGRSIAINIPQPTSFPKFDSVQYAKCTPNTIRAFYSAPIRCASIVANGSDFLVTGSSAVTIIGATPDVTCATNGYTNWVDVQLSQPISLQGIYSLHNKVGTDGNGILDTCFSPQNVNETIDLNILGKLNAGFSSTVQWDCVTDTIVLSHPGGNGINSWEWTFSDGTTQTGQSVKYLAATTTPSVTITLKVDNGFCNETTTQTVPLGNYFKPGISLMQNDTLCFGTPVTLLNQTVGGIGLQHLWQFGDATIYNGVTPPPHLYALTQPYTIRLIVNDIYGCIDTAEQKIVVAPTAFINIDGVKPQYCAGQTLLLTKVTTPYVDTYTWDNGNGKTWNNTRSILFKYDAENPYTITLTGMDRFCGQVITTKNTQVYAIPRLELGRDTVLCSDDIIQIGTAFNPAYTYTWNTGETAAQISTGFASQKYSLLVDNHGCSSKDEIYIKKLAVCLIKMPNAFTPNGDGKNDVLRATNADLAKAFKLNIYNRVGELIYTTQNSLQGWDGNYKGQPADPGTYVWELSYINPWTGKAVYEKGTSILIK
ncbi:MAG: gliding motility-associated C-terminal domain-containing protein [Ferruginibacter sp.]|nr:gliding motility-associated C-terminal domain-containing protein [Ferruginibacter sp.]